MDSLHSTIITTAVVLWFAQGWYLNVRLREVHKKLDKLLEECTGLRVAQFGAQRRLQK